MKETISSRFGDIQIDREHALAFPHGLLGFPQCGKFALAAFPAAKMPQFKILQSLDDLSLSFLTLPLGRSNALILPEDIAAAALDLGIETDHLALMLIVSVQRTPLRTVITANTRAPIFLDTSRRLGAQYVFPSDRYQVQHEIG